MSKGTRWSGYICGFTRPAATVLRSLAVVAVKQTLRMPERLLMS
jgi:hypothetical protein